MTIPLEQVIIIIIIIVRYDLANGLPGMGAKPRYGGPLRSHKTSNESSSSQISSLLFGRRVGWGG